MPLWYFLLRRPLLLTGGCAFLGVEGITVCSVAVTGTSLVLHSDDTKAEAMVSGIPG